MPTRFTTLELTALLCAALALLWSVVAAVSVVPAYETMFLDFTADIPLFTRICLLRPVILGFGAIPLALLGFGAALTSRSKDSIFPMLAIMLSISAPALFFAGMQLPLALISGRVG